MNVVKKSDWDHVLSLLLDAKSNPVLLNQMGDSAVTIAQSNGTHVLKALLREWKQKFESTSLFKKHLLSSEVKGPKGSSNCRLRPKE